MPNVVIIGAGHAAGQVVATLKQKRFGGRITVLGDEVWPPYQRPPLSKKYLAGELPAERLFIKPPGFYDDDSIELRLDTRVTTIDRDRGIVSTADGAEVAYDALVIATGSRARRLDLPGTELPGVHYLRGIDDVDQIRQDLKESCRVAIIGAGYIGLEVAAVARQMGHDVTVLEMAERVMSRVVSAEVSAFYARVHQRHGVDIRLATSLISLSGETHLEKIELGSGESLPADIAIIGIGIEPNVELAMASGLEVDQGVIVDDRCQTSDPKIYAVGDCTYHPNAIYGTRLRLESVQNALEQAKTAALNIVGEISTYTQVPWFWSDQYDLKLQIAGLSMGYDQTVVRGDESENSFSCVYLKDGVVIAIDAINRPKDFMQCKPLIAERRQVDTNRLADPAVDLKDV